MVFPAALAVGVLLFLCRAVAGATVYHSEAQEACYRQWEEEEPNGLDPSLGAALMVTHSHFLPNLFQCFRALPHTKLHVDLRAVRGGVVGEVGAVERTHRQRQVRRPLSNKADAACWYVITGGCDRIVRYQCLVLTCLCCGSAVLLAALYIWTNR